MKRKVMRLKSMFVFFTVVLFLFGVNIGFQAEGAGNENCAKLEDLYLPNTFIIIRIPRTTFFYNPGSGSKIDYVILF